MSLDSSFKKYNDEFWEYIDKFVEASEIKLLFVYTDEEKIIIYEFQNKKYMKALMINRG